MERSRLKLLLEQELLQNAQQARILCGSPVTRFVAQTAGGVAADGNPAGGIAHPTRLILLWAGRLDLSAEASAVKNTVRSLPTRRSTPASTLLWKAVIFQKRGR